MTNWERRVFGRGGISLQIYTSEDFWRSLSCPVSSRQSYVELTKSKNGIKKWHQIVNISYIIHDTFFISVLLLSSYTPFQIVKFYPQSPSEWIFNSFLDFLNSLTQFQFGPRSYKDDLICRSCLRDPKMNFTQPFVISQIRLLSKSLESKIL